MISDPCMIQPPVPPEDLIHGRFPQIVGSDQSE